MDRSSAQTELQAHFARYFDACDRADFDAVLEILDGATLVAGPVETDDPVAIRQAYASSHPAPDPDGRRLSKNHLTTLIVEGPDSDGVWTASAHYFRLEPGSDGPRVTRSGRLAQRLRRSAGPGGERWQVLRHQVISDF